MKENSVHLAFDSSEYVNVLFGPLNKNLKFMSELTGIRISSFGNELIIKVKNKVTTQEDLDIVSNVFIHCYKLIEKGQNVTNETFEKVYNSFKDNLDIVDDGKAKDNALSIKTPKRTLFSRNDSQKEYIKLMENNEITFGIGPAGTGKTYLAVAMGIQYLMAKKVKKIVLTRPAIEAGEKLGFLPGTLEEKIDPYLRPLFDALDDMLGKGFLDNKSNAGVIEIAPLAFMRGRTISNSFIILDEAQNTTPEQMKMLLTRMGFGSRMVITGDITQIDLPPQLIYSEENKNNRWLPREVKSGLVECVGKLKDISGIGIHEFKSCDVVRHPLVSKIVNAL